ncbi:hypothetical protein ACA910_016148 [Epithemia clementina (nom. ined.)]
MSQPRRKQTNKDRQERAELGKKDKKMNVGGLLFGILLAIVVHLAWDVIFPWGGPVPLVGEIFRQFAPVNYSEDSLTFKHGRTKRIYGRRSGDLDDDLIRGPETVVLNPTQDGVLYLLTEEGLLVSLTNFTNDENDSTIVNATTTVVRNLGNGRPLGGSFTSDGKTLYIADAVLGLTRIQNVQDSRSKVEIVASAIRFDEGDGKHQISKLRYVDDLCIGPKTQKVYFTDASEMRPDMIGRNIPDTMYASKVDFLRGIPTGRVLEYDPETDQVRVLAKGIHFANGIAVDKDETFVLFAETFGPRILKYHLQGDNAGAVEVVIDRPRMMGYPDGMDCNHMTNKCYAVMPSSIVPAHKALAALPDFLALGLRYLILMLPRQFSPPTQPFGGVLEIDVDTSEFHYLLDPSGKDISMLCGVTAYKDRLYLGSLENPFVGVYHLPE